MKIILRNTGLIFLMTFLAVLYIYNTHSAEGKLRRINTLEKDVADAKSQYQKVKSDINYKCTETQLAKALVKQGLKKNIQSPMLIEGASK